MGSLCAPAWDIAGRPAKGEGLSAPQFRESSFTMSVNNANGLARVGTEATADCPRPTNPEEGETGRNAVFKLPSPLLFSPYTELTSTISSSIIGCCRVSETHGLFTLNLS